MSRSLETLVRKCGPQKAVVLLSCTCLVAANLIFGSQGLSTANACASLLSTIYLVIDARRNALAVVFLGFVLLCTWSICYAFYFSTRIQSEYTAYRGTDIAAQSSYIYLVFTLGMALLFPSKLCKFPDLSSKGRTHAEELLGIGLVLSTPLFGLQGLGEMWRGNRMAINPLYEYSVILFIFGALYLRRSRWGWILTVLVCAFRVALDFGSGNRITGVEFLLALLLVGYACNFGLRRAIPVGLLLMSLVLAVGEMRAYVDSNRAFQAGISSYFREGLAWDGAYSAYHTSMCFVDVGNGLSDASRMSFVKAFLLSIVFGGDVEKAFVSRTIYDTCWNMGGGYLPFHFYFYSGALMVFLSGGVVGLFFRFVATQWWLRSDVAKAAVVWIGASTFRWFQYYPFSTIRGLIFLIVFGWTVTGFGKMLTRQLDG